ncbi:MAG: 4-hydroxythreonine-4-phosphate dehydrogenase PdxA [Pseudomonadales bacterium]
MSRILVTPGEPGGIGPDVLCAIAQQSRSHQLCAVADPELLADRAAHLGLPLRLHIIDNVDESPFALKSGELAVVPVALSVAAKVGFADPLNASYVVSCLDKAISLCLDAKADAMVTGPINKASIIEGGYEFTGHTEYLAAKTDTDTVVMMLASEQLRVALVTTHLPLQDVPAAITRDRLRDHIRILHTELMDHFAAPAPRILVCGLNPHAGEQGHLGREEIELIEPVCNEFRAAGMHIIGPLPADTAFTPTMLQQADAVLAMYHDQGLPVIKALSFGEVVNVTLGLPIIRTSVDHGTALDIAGSGTADASSLGYAIDCAVSMSARRGLLP